MHTTVIAAHAHSYKVQRRHIHRFDSLLRKGIRYLDRSGRAYLLLYRWSPWKSQGSIFEYIRSRGLPAVEGDGLRVQRGYALDFEPYHHLKELRPAVPFPIGERVVQKWSGSQERGECMIVAADEQQLPGET